jgi:hypothetical protein
MFISIIKLQHNSHIFNACNTNNKGHKQISDKSNCDEISSLAACTKKANYYRDKSVRLL